jgi:hypothetical protein
MIFKRSNIGSCKLIVATALMLGMMTGISHAYTLEQQELCAGDAMRLCSSDIPDVERITACMARQRDQLSEGCKAIFEVETPAAATTETPVNETPSARPSKPINLTPKFKHG